MKAGSTLGGYEILSLAGSGGMGEVYHARDLRLGREVAIKVLPADRMADESRRQRFAKEARAASALNHPNIVTIYGIESVEGIDIIVMEYVPGRRLDWLIPQQGLGLGAILRFAIPIADALASAHARGIVHRDIKPHNVMVTQDGVVKVLDFGLAKLVHPSDEPVGSDVMTASAPEGRSGPGVVVGTLGYMAPEQASGGEVDARSDVFSFGALLYEMATGRRAFTGASSAEVLAALLKEQPKAPRDLVPDLPRELERVIQRCLQKDPARRFQHTLDVKLELEQIKEESDTGRIAVRPAHRTRSVGWLGGGLAVVLGLAAVAAWWLRPGPPLDPPRLEQATSMIGPEENPTLSPDGEQLAFVWKGEKQDNADIYLKAIGSSDVRRLTTDPGADYLSRWSPDGKLIAFARHGPDLVRRIHLVSPITGSERRLSDFQTGGHLSWSPDSLWLAVTPADSAVATGSAPTEPGTLYLLPVDGGAPKALRIPGESARVVQPTFSPDGRGLAYYSGVVTGWHINVVDLGSDYVPLGPPRRVTRRPVWAMDNPVWTRDGKSLLFSDWSVGRLWRVEITGDRAPQPVEIAGFGTARPALASGRDRLVFVKGLSTRSIYRFEAGRPIAPVVASSIPFQSLEPDFSPDGRRLAFSSNRSGRYEVWVAEADGSSPKQLTHGQGLYQGSPRWSPDGRRLTFDAQDEDGTWHVWTIDADGGSPRRLTRAPGNENLSSWSRDGRYIYFSAQRGDAAGPGGSAYDVRRVSVSGGPEESIARGGTGPVLMQESIDGTTLFFKSSLRRSPLVAQSLAGGPPREVAECVAAFAIVRAGLYTLECSDEQAIPLYLRETATSRPRLVTRLEGAQGSRLAVSPDGQAVLFARWSGEGSDLMMIENFR